MKTTMKLVSKTCAATLLLCLLCSHLNAQMVKHAYGLHGGVCTVGTPITAGVSYKAYFSPFLSMEAIAYTNFGLQHEMAGLETSLLYNLPIGNSRHLFWYAGGGFLVNRLDKVVITNEDREDEKKEHFITWQYGMQVKGGIEFKFHHFPINVAFDVAPLMLFNPKIAAGVKGQFAIRYTIPNRHYSGANYVNRTKVDPEGKNVKKGVFNRL